jgi:putative effector of murein hydrolase
MAILALVVMLWILWSDTLRKRRSPPAFYALRIALFLICAAILVLNRIRYPWYFTGNATLLVVVGVIVGVGGAVYFARRLVRRV